MLARVADCIYWMNRYIERAENAARLIDVNLQLALDLAGDDEQWAPVIATTGAGAAFAERYGEPSRESALRFLSFDPTNPSSIISCIAQARENARQIRDVISSEMWETLNTAHLTVLSAAQQEEEVLGTPHDFLDEVKALTHRYLGVTYLSMSHNEAWHFGRLGRLLERADQTSRIVDMKYFVLLPDPSDVGSTYDGVQWSSLLRSVSALEMYHKVHGRLDSTRAIEFLLKDRKFPRSIRYCVVKAERSLHAITGRPIEPSGEPFSLRDLSQVTESNPEADLRALRIECESKPLASIVKMGLHEYLDAFQRQLIGIGDGVARTFFGH